MLTTKMQMIHLRRSLFLPPNRRRKRKQYLPWKNLPGRMRTTSHGVIQSSMTSGATDSVSSCSREMPTIYTVANQRVFFMHFEVLSLAASHPPMLIPCTKGKIITLSHFGRHFGSIMILPLTVPTSTCSRRGGCFAFPSTQKRRLCNLSRT